MFKWPIRMGEPVVLPSLEMKKGTGMRIRNFAAFVIPVLLFPLISLAAEIRCPDLEVSSTLAKPAMSVPLASERSLIVCGFTDRNTPGEFTDAVIYSVKKDGAIDQKIFASDAFQNFKIKSLKDGFQLTELLMVSGVRVPVFDSKITCTPKICTQSHELCIFKAKPVPDAGYLEELDTYQMGKNRTKIPDVSLIASLASLAYSGNRKAQKFFLNGRDTVHLDAGPGEEFDFAQTMVSRLRGAKCLR